MLHYLVETKTLVQLLLTIEKYFWASTLCTVPSTFDSKKIAPTVLLHDSTTDANFLLDCDSFCMNERGLVFVVVYHLSAFTCASNQCMKPCLTKKKYILSKTFLSMNFNQVHKI